MKTVVQNTLLAIDENYSQYRLTERQIGFMPGLQAFSGRGAIPHRRYLLPVTGGTSPRAPGHFYAGRGQADPV
ncbi:hypothetical protein SXCC_01328 [Gluconacetobacter sp. SXCC-1]|nr:hypothetical protein SXCC_01328 [Gluconacetobacter sp. SXCC-1]